MTDAVAVGGSAGQSEEVTQGLLGDPRRQQDAADLPLGQQRVLHLRELLIGEVLAVAQQTPSRLPFRVAGASAPSAGFGSGATPDHVEHLVGELDDVEVVDHDGGVGQVGADRGAVGGRHVDGDMAEVVAPGQRRGGHPCRDVGDGAALDLAEEPAVARRVDEPGVPPVPGQVPALAG